MILPAIEAVSLHWVFVTEAVPLRKVYEKGRIRRRQAKNLASRQSKEKSASFVGSAFCPYLSSVSRNDMFRDGKAQPGTSGYFFPALYPFEFGENLFEIVFVNSTTGI
jgi:hypothetical protein